MTTAKRYIYYTCLSLALLSVYPLVAQQRRGKVRSTPTRANITELIDSARRAYLSYHFSEAIDALSHIKEQGQTDSLRQLITSLRDRSERAERMLPLTEPKQVLHSEECPWAELKERLALYAPELSKSLNFTTDSLGQYSMEQSGGLGLYRWRLSPQGIPSDLYRHEELATGTPHEQRASYALDSNINTKPSEERNPFLLSDGIKLIFASNRSDGLGGYDLYMSRYNAERNHFLEAIPLGMPYNSPANDYLLIYDEEQNRSYLVSDREASEGMIRLYILEGLPRSISGKRQGEEIPEMPEEEARSWAMLAKRQATEPESLSPRPTVSDRCYLPLDGEEQILRWSDFVSKEAMELYRTYLSREEELHEYQRQYSVLQTSRSQGREQEELRHKIEKIEGEQETLLRRVRNTEIKTRKRL